MNLRILAKNLADTADISADPAALATLPATNVLLPTERNRVARATVVGTWVLTLTWPTDQRVNEVAVTRHNLSTGGTIQAVVSQALSPTDLYDSTAQQAFSTAGMDTDLDDYTDTEFLGYKNTILYLPNLVTQMRQLDIVLVDPTPIQTDDLIEVNRVWAGKYFEFAYNPAFEKAELQPMDSSVMDHANDGTQIVDRGYVSRRLTLDLDFISDAELPSVLAMARRIGKNGECLVDLYPGDNTAKGIYNRMACRLVDSPTFNPAQYGYSRNTMTFEES